MLVDLTYTTLSWLCLSSFNTTFPDTLPKYSNMHDLDISEPRILTITQVNIIPKFCDFWTKPKKWSTLISPHSPQQGCGTDEYLFLILGVIKNLIRFFQQYNLPVREDVVWLLCSPTIPLQKYSHPALFPISLLRVRLCSLSSPLGGHIL